MLDDKTVQERLSANILHFLSMHKMTQQQLARKTGETDMFVSRIVRKIHIPNVAAMSRIAEALDVSVDQLLAEPSRKFSKTA